MVAEAAAAAIAALLVTVLVMMIGVYPGAVTVPPETIETCGAGVDDAEPLALLVETETSRIGAPKFIAPVAKAAVYLAYTYAKATALLLGSSIS